ncbi:hypothetical protein RND81_01G023600 [Saponaria officinalis]|uniref:Uncharacterized protein n=1 Tax=Saponaria officinalis TaxID=3572 RepID=A0AAW1N8C8_SAPOF
MKSCMNKKCGTTSSGEWKTGWSLRSGEFAHLCDKCGYAFDQHIYCEEFHTDESGWRKCDTCGKRLHCGCIASLTLIELLDDGGVKCIACARNSDLHSSWNGGKSTRYGRCAMSESNLGSDNQKDNTGSNQLSIPQNLNANVGLGLLKHENLIFPTAETGAATPSPPPIGMDTAVKCGPWRGESTWASTLAQTSTGSFMKDRLDLSGNMMQSLDHYESVAHPNLNISLSILSGNLQFSSGTVIDEREQIKMSNSFNQGFASPGLAPAPTQKLSFSPPADANVSMMSQLRLSRPPGEGRGRHQLLPRYWPRITDQELQQISGDSKCTIIPLFEKVLSASDAGRIGRLVLPKACAEAYFPPISQPEGLPIKIQDVKGNEWVFQFRFWPNNNSRMYVLEGVTPCIQSMQLQAGDTVTFSRKDPEGKLVMGFRKASSSSVQNLPVPNGSSGVPQTMKGCTDTHMNALSRQLDSSGVNGEPTEEGLLSSSTMMTGSKKGRNIGAKSKRLLIDNQDAQALKLTWEEVQGMLRPPLNAKPSIVVIEDFEFEEYEEPPVFGKSSVFATRSPGVIEQWAQCDSCSKWRRFPPDYLLPPKWTCTDNSWDPTRCFCSAPDELSPRELEVFLTLSKDSTKKRMTMANKASQEQDSCGLSALANAAVLGDNPNEPGTSAVATTTKHPRHRAGCSCIVCIQPPSGKGKHNSACTCTVCMTVKRRFKTLMMRKKKRQSDQEAELILKTQHINKSIKEDDKVDDNVEGQNIMAELGDCSGLDLNCHPEHEEDLKTQDGLVNGLSSLTPEEQVEETEGQRVEEQTESPSLQEEARPNDGSCELENTNKPTDSR